MALPDNIKRITNNRVTLENIDNITDDELLAYIALHNKDFDISREALSRIKSDSVLASLVHSGGPNTLSRIGGRALIRISDENIIADLWCSSEIELSEESLDKVSDPELLKRIADSAPNSANKNKAINSIPNSENESLMDIYEKSSRWPDRLTIVRKINDEDTLKYIASSDSIDMVRAAAIDRINDESFLMNIVENFDPNSVINGALNAKYDCVREAAVRNISDKSFLEDVVVNDEDKHIRDEAAKRLKELDK